MLEKIQEKRWNEVRAELLDIHPSEVAALIANLPENERTIVFRLLPEENAASAFAYLDKHTQQSIIKRYGK